ncbi:MAG TPA: ankyrin repeat domain-containing protein [Burkholderiaceae bacterium]
MMSSLRTRRSLLEAIALGVAFSVFPFGAHAMPSPNKVFTDPAVIELATACMDGKADRVASLLHQGADVHAVGKLGMTVPHFALLAQANAPQVMKLVLDAGGDPVSVLDGGETLPMYAVSRDNADPEVVRVLLDHGISPNWHPPKEPFRNTSLLFGAISGHNRPVVRLLLQRGADVNYDDGFSGSALHRAMTAYQFGIAADLVDAGIRLDLTTNSRPSAKPTSKRKTALAQYCEDEGGKRGANPLPEIAAGWRELEAALARRGEKMPCTL